jgi:hypothetical protein
LKSSNIAFSTLQERISEGQTKSPKLERNVVFTKEQLPVTSRVKLLAKLFDRVCSLQLRRVAFEFAKRNEIKHNFNKDSRTAVKEWMVTFLKKFIGYHKKTVGYLYKENVEFFKEETV